MKKIKTFFGSKKATDKNGASTLSTINSLREMEDMLLKKQDYFETQVQAQLVLAKKFGLKNKRAALLALKRKKRFEMQLSQVDGTLTTIEMQREALEMAKNNVSVLQAMKLASTALKDAQLHLDADKVHDIMDDISEQQDLAREIADAISSPVAFALDVDESDLEKELEELEQEELDKELLKVEPVITAKSGSEPSEKILDSSPTVPSNLPREETKSSRTEEDKELEDLAQWGSI